VRYSGERQWTCLCDCGARVLIRQLYLRNGKTRSCGCIRAEQLADRHRTHGMTESAEYNIWSGMKRRCHDPNGTRMPFAIGGL
jgi:hypothetical protein